MRYLIFTGGEKNNLFDLLFRDLKELERVQMVSSLPEVPAGWKRLYRLHHARSLNRQHPAPLRGIWGFTAREAERLLVECLEKDRELCVIWNNFSIPYFEPSMIRRWQRSYGIRTVLYFIDRMSSYYAAEARMYMGQLRFDAVYSYYRRDAEAYGLRYLDCYYSVQPTTGEQRKRCNLFFWGSDDGRRELIEQVYQRVRELGGTAEVGICFAQGERNRLDGIVYDQPREYAELIEGVQGADVLLDVIAGEGGVSLRYYEALAYGKRLLSNNPEVKRMRLYDSEQVVYFSEPQEIQEAMLRKPDVAYPYRDEFSPRHWIQELDTLWEG